jgi:hypothetical protein
VFAVNGHLHTSRSLLPATGLVEANTKQYKVNRALPQDPSVSAIGLSQINLNSAYETACLALILYASTTKTLFHFGLHPRLQMKPFLLLEDPVPPHSINMDG